MPISEKFTEFVGKLYKDNFLVRESENNNLRKIEHDLEQIK